MHARQQAHEVVKQNERNAQENLERNLALWIAQFKLRFVHVRKYDEYEFEELRLNPKGGATIAYTLPERKGGRILRVSQALVHDNDVFCKKAGRYYAAKNYYNGQIIQMRVKDGMTPATYLKEVFGG